MPTGMNNATDPHGVNNIMRNALSLTLGAAVLAMTSLAGAQDVTVSTTAAQPSTTTSTGGSITDTSGPTDHSVVVGRLGLRYFGSVSVPLLTGSAGVTGAAVPNFGGGQGFASVNGLGASTMDGNHVYSSQALSSSGTLHTVGLRYWLNSSLGLEAGIAFGVGSLNTSATRFNEMTRVNSTGSDAQPSYFGFGFQAGLPIVLAESKHLTINLTPTLGFYYASSALEVPDAGRSMLFPGAATISNSSSSILFALGANLGAELQFGFLGIPQLGLQAQFGLNMQFTSQSATAIVAPGNREYSMSRSSFGLGTTVGNFSLEDIITGSLAAVWYFGSAR